MTPRPPDGHGDGRPDEEGDGPDPAGWSGPPADGGGWIPVEHRLWRHPSEMESLRAGAPASGPPRPATRPRPTGRRRSLGLAVVGTGAAAAVAVGLVLLDGGGSGPVPEPASTASATVAVTVSRSILSEVPTGTAGTEQGLVAVVATTAHGARTGCGVAVAQGGWVVTTADAVLGGTSVSVVTAAGLRERARVLALDRTSDLALLQVPNDLPVPRFVDESLVHTGNPALAVVMISPSAVENPETVATMIPTIRSGVIEAVGTPVPSGSAAGMAAISADIPMSPPGGAVLVRPDGAVLGLLDQSASSGTSDGQTVYLPSDLVLGVAGELRSEGRVRHGWLDIDGRDVVPGTAAPTPGILVSRVMPRGAAHNLLVPGDVVTGVNGTPVQSMAQLRAAIYVLAPGTAVDLTVMRQGLTTVVSVVLGRSP